MSKDSAMRYFGGPWDGELVQLPKSQMQKDYERSLYGSEYVYWAPKQTWVWMPLLKEDQ